MLSLQGKEDAVSLYEYGCGLYSMTYYGKAHEAYQYYRSTTDEKGYFNTPQRMALSGYEQDYYSANSAEKAFINAAKKTTNPELKARCLWMAAKCWQKRAPLPTAASYYGNEELSAYYRHSLSNPYFAQLREGALATSPFIQKAYNSCVYLQDYVRTKKK